MLKLLRIALRSEIQRKLHAEACRAIELGCDGGGGGGGGGGGELTADVMGTMVYHEAVLKETLRMDTPGTLQ